MRSVAGNVMRVAHVSTQMDVMSWELPLSSVVTSCGLWYFEFHCVLIEAQIQVSACCPCPLMWVLLFK